MISLIVFLFIALTVYLFAGSIFLAKDMLRTFGIAMGLCAAGCYLFVGVVFKAEQLEPTLKYLLAIPLFILGIWYVRYVTKTAPLEIVANQQRYWKNLTPKLLYKWYQQRKDKKSDRIEIKINQAEKQLIKTLRPNSQYQEDKVINPSFFIDLARLEGHMTIVKDIDELKSYPLYKEIFAVIEKQIKEREESVNLIEILEQNEYCAEFFIMDLWPRFTNDINIGNANLELLAENETQRQLVFALDNLDLYNVKNKGSALYYKFMLFKNKVKDYVSDIEVEEEYIEENDENGDRDL